MSIGSIREERDRRIDFEGTPPAIFLNTGDIAVNTNDGGWIIDFQEETKTKRYTPYSVIQINNNSSTGLNVYVNQNRTNVKVCRPQTILVIKDFPAIRNVRISKRDVGVTLVAGDVEVNVERPPLSDNEYRRREHRKPLIQKFLNRFLGLGG